MDTIVEAIAGVVRSCLGAPGCNSRANTWDSLCRMRRHGRGDELVGGAGCWHSRRGRPAAADDELSEEDLDVPVCDIPLPVPPREQAAGPSAQACEEPLTAEEPHESSSTIVSTATYEAIRDIYTPANEVKQKTGELLLKGRMTGQYRLYNDIDLDGEQLELAAHLSSGATPLDCQLYAKQVAADACRTRCGSECTGDCCVRAFVMVSNYGTDFYFGSAEDIAHAVLTQSAACSVYYWDDLEEYTMRKLNQHIDSLLETEPGLVMRTTQLKTVPGQVCSLAALTSCSPTDSRL